MYTVITEKYTEPPIDRGEILRYMGSTDTPDVSALLNDCLAETLDVLSYRSCWLELPIIRDGDILDLTFTRTSSKALAKNLHGCDRFVLFAATIGIGIDRLIMRYGKISPAKAFCIQAIGAERIESLCDMINNGVSQKYNTRPRFSPGYGDLPLSVQNDIFRILDCSRKIGLSLCESGLMSPTKSVTAIIGIKSSSKEKL